MRPASLPQTTMSSMMSRLTSGCAHSTDSVPAIWFSDAHCLITSTSNRFPGFLRFHEVAHEHVAALDAHLTLIGHGKVLHLWHVYQLDTAARYWRTHVLGHVVALYCQCDRRHALRLAVTLHNLQEHK
ncbi:hypothetical protein B566_EDAN008028 [Ephemera danica]|nr:hypothetical protein B566_EDAN008028 [Ephemera danica]